MIHKFSEVGLTKFCYTGALRDSEQLIVKDVTVDIPEVKVEFLNNPEDNIDLLCSLRSFLLRHFARKAALDKKYAEESIEHLGERKTWIYLYSKELLDKSEENIEDEANNFLIIK